MTNNDFEIDPSKIKRRKRPPLPPGQTRHKYDQNAPDVLADDDDDEATSQVDLDDEMWRRRKRRRTPSRRVTANEQPPRLVRFFFDSRTAFFIGLASIILGAFLLLVLLSYIKSGEQDQSLINNVTLQQIKDDGLEVKSDVGLGGVWLGNQMFARGFGVGAIVAAVYFLILGCRLVRRHRFGFWSLTFKSLLLMVSSSIIVALFTYSLASPTFWGGIHGHYVNKWLLTMTGAPGAIAVSLLLLSALIAVYFNGLKKYYEIIRTAIDKRREHRNMVRELRQQGRKTRAEAEIAEQDDDVDDVEEIDEDEENHIADVNLGRAVVAGRGVATDVAATDVAANAATEPKSPTAGADVIFEIDEPSTPATPAVAGPAGMKVDVAKIETGPNTGTVASSIVAAEGEYDPRAELSRFRFPTLDLLEDHPLHATGDTEEQESNKDRIIKTLGDFKITIESIKATVGPTVTLYEIEPTKGIRVAQIKRLEDDIAMSLKAKGIRIIAPMPGKGTVGIEVPNREPQVVSMRTILSSKKFRESKAKLPIALGATITDEIFVADLASMPHALVAGATGQGKSVGLNVLITSLLYRKHPSELKFVLIDPKKVEFSVYERLRGHYLASLPDEDEAVVTDPDKVLNVLNSLCVEMDQRYALLRNAAVNKLEDYNHKFVQRRLDPEKGHRYLPYIVVIIDEFADLIMTGGREIEMPVMRITQKARAVGIHMIIATQRPSTNVLTGLIKANCPTRIAFRVQQNVDSRTILDAPGAERLIGRGDMLFSQNGEMVRMQCAFVSSDEVERVSDFVDAQPGFEHPYMLPDPNLQSDTPFTGTVGGGMDRDPLFDDAARFVVMSNTASTSSLQRRFQIGYNRAGKIMDQMEAAGIVGPASGSKPRAVLTDPTSLERILANR